jgi:hypothetical protein
MTTIQKKTLLVKSLIERAKSSGVAAWKAGKILDSLFSDDFRSNASEFNKYTQDNFGITGITAKKYIDLFKAIPFEKIPEGMLVTHLYPLVATELKIRFKVLDVLTNKLSNKKRLFTGNDINALINFVEISDRKLSYEEIEAKLWEIVKKRKNKKRLTFNEQGTPIKFNYFHEIADIFPNEPISEQGLVGLFCAMFYLLRNFRFQYGYKFLNFCSIECIRTAYPDARIKALDKNRRFLVNLNVEFELDSRNYILHGHHKEKEKCDLIICWNNNLLNLSDTAIQKISCLSHFPIDEFPKILALNELFELGVIELHDLTRSQ